MTQYGILVVYLTVPVLRYVPGASGARARYTSRRAITRYHNESRESAQEIVNEYASLLTKEELQNYTFQFQPHAENMVYSTNIR